MRRVLRVFGKLLLAYIIAIAAHFVLLVVTTPTIGAPPTTIQGIFVLAVTIGVFVASVWPKRDKATI